MGRSNYLERYFGEITALPAFKTGARDYFLTNYFAIESVLAPKRGQKRSVLCDQHTVWFGYRMHTPKPN
jgi:hypothetical protein